MHKFHIGQRVKKVRGDRNIGLTGVVVGLDYVSPGLSYSKLVGGVISLTEACDIQVVIDSSWRNVDGLLFPKHAPAYSRAEYFEPIAPDGAKASTMSFQELMDSLHEVQTDSARV